MLMLKVVGIFGSEVFCAWGYGCVVTDVLSGVEEIEMYIVGVCYL